jgi:hypothetical protein
MNTCGNLTIDEESSDEGSKVFYVSKINPGLPWPSNTAMASFVSGGNFKRFKILEIGDPNVKVIKIK